MSATLLLGRAEVERLLTPGACIAAVEDAFRGLALGKVPAPGMLGMHAEGGSFHVKAGFLATDRPYFASKVNANFPGNAARGLPTIQGVVLLFDAVDGQLLAVMDSIGITALRTAAASAVAARHLARERIESLLVCGCGAQAAAQARCCASGGPEGCTPTTWSTGGPCGSPKSSARSWASRSRPPPASPPQRPRATSS